MRFFRYIAMLVLSVSIVAVGIPAQAKQDCPMMMKQAEMQSMNAPPCHGSQEMKTQPQSQKKSGCCGELACKIKCSAAGSMILFHSSKAELPQVTDEAQRLRSASAAFILRALNTHDRPPKHFS